MKCRCSIKNNTRNVCFNNQSWGLLVDAVAIKGEILLS